MIKHIGHEWILYTADGSKVLGRHPTKAKAEAQERAVEANKIGKSELVPTRAFPVRIVKSDATRQIAMGVVLEPCTAETTRDSQGDWYTAEDIEKAAHGFLEAVAKGDGGADLMHQDDGDGPLVGFPVESFIAPIDFVWGEGDRTEIVTAGSWVMGVHYPDAEIWSQIVKGELGAFSVWGKGMRVFE